MSRLLPTFDDPAAWSRVIRPLVREWLPSWSGSVVLHGAAMFCFVAVSEFGPQAWPVVKGQASVASAPAIDSRAGGLLASTAELTEPIRFESIATPDTAITEPFQPNPQALSGLADTNAETQDVIEQQLAVVVRRLPIPQTKPKTEPLRVDPAPIRDRELLQPITPSLVEEKLMTDTESANGQAVTSGNSAENATDATASAASRGAEENQLPQPAATNPDPPYPEDARAARQQGRVTLRLRIGADGRCESVKLLRSSGFSSLDESALTTVKQWRFEPARRLGRPIAMEVKHVITFEIATE